jgi:hypothetical protein
MNLSFQKLRNALKASENIRGMKISKDDVTTTYCWNNSLLHSAVRRTQENQEDVNLDNLKVLLEKAKEYKNLESALAQQMRWEGDDESRQTNRFSSVDGKFLLMTPFTFAIYMGKKKAVEEILKIDKETLYYALAHDISSNITSTHENRHLFYAKISNFLTSRSIDLDIVL